MFQPRKMLLLASGLLLLSYVQITSSCLCLLIKNYKCPEPPTCCESGQYTLDECGCCMKCAKAELQTCGGASGVSGKCAGGLQCLKTCLPCKTVGDRGLPCVFPFKYEDSYGNWTYNTCTTKDSDDGQPWCATAVDSSGYVVDNAWGDCLDGCPGTRVECDDKYFSIQDGKCIDVSVPGAIPNWFGAPAVRLEEAEPALFPAPVCRNKGAAVRLYDNTCRCDRGETALDLDLAGEPRGNCTGLEDDPSDNLDKVWCFLENIRDPGQPRQGCYSDTQWSERDGRYWSSLACSQAPDIEGGSRSQQQPRHRLAGNTIANRNTNNNRNTHRDNNGSTDNVKNGNSNANSDPVSSAIRNKNSNVISRVNHDSKFPESIQPVGEVPRSSGFLSSGVEGAEEQGRQGNGGISFTEEGGSNLFDVLKLLDL